jgi:hypothetical protein
MVAIPRPGVKTADACSKAAFVNAFLSIECFHDDP